MTEICPGGVEIVFGIVVSSKMVGSNQNNKNVKYWPKHKYVYLNEPSFFWEVGRPPACAASRPAAAPVQRAELRRLLKGADPSRSRPGTPALRPPRAAVATPAKDHPYAVPRDSSDEGGSGPEHQCRAWERLQRWEPGQKTKRDASADSAKDYRPKAAIPLTDPPGNVHPEGPCQGVAAFTVQLEMMTKKNVE